MNDGRSNRKLTDEQLLRIHEFCQRFELELSNGTRLSIEDCLAQADDPLKSALIEELLEIEIESKLEIGDLVDVGEYRSRFPDHVSEIDRVWQKISPVCDTDLQETGASPNPSGDPQFQQSTLDSSGIQAGGKIGPYRLLQPIGEGGMGTVWMAEQQKPVRRTVAIKIIKAGMDTREVIARFEAERQALAMMNHPNIAKVLDAGETKLGRPYFVMELVSGTPITRFCDDAHLQTDQRLRLFTSVCRAVQHAHQKGIIHRDIKPSNVLVAMHDDEPVVKVIDFGLAKATGRSLTDKTMFTALGQMVGTPAYMSPEQADVGGLDIDTRTDVYSLGVLLYELLTGVTPLDIKQLRSAGYAEIQRMIREQDPQAMSNRLSSLGDNSQVVATNRATDSKRLKKNLRGDLDLIVMKSLEKDRNRRYETPSNFAADVDRFLNNEAIEARPASARYRLKKLIRRNKTAVLTTAIVCVALLAGTAVSVWQAIRATQARDAEIVQRKVADDALLAEQDANRSAQKRLGQLVKINEVIGSVFRDLDPELEEDGGPPLRTQLVDRIDEVSNLIVGETIGDPLMVAAMQLTLGVAQNNLGDQKNSRELLTKSFDVRKQKLGEDHLDTLIVLVEIAESELAMGEYKSAASKYQQAFLGLKRILGPEHPITLRCMKSLADSHNRVGDREKGLELQQQALELATQALGPEHETTLQIQYMLAKQNYDYNDREHDKESKRLYADHLAKRIKSNGPDHYSTIQARKGLANVELNAGDRKVAIELYQSVLDGMRNKLGAEHASTVRAKCSLAYAYCQTDKVNEGLEMLSVNVPKLGLLLGEDNPIHMNWLNLLAYSYEQNDYLENAIKFHTEALRLRARKLGEDNPETLDSLGNLGFCCRRAGRFDEAVKHYQRGLPGMRKRYPADHLVLTGYLNNFGESLVKGEQFEQAVPILRECIPLLEKALGGTKDGWKTYRAKAWLGTSLLGLKQYEAAETELIVGYEGMLVRQDKIKAKDKINIDEAAESLLRIYESRNAAGDKAKAEKLKASLDSSQE